MNIAIVGYATEGISSAKYWQNQGHEVTVCDQNQELVIPDVYKKQLGPDYLANLDRFDLIVRSAGIHPSVLLKDNPSIESKITTNIEEFVRVSPTQNLIGVTGTKGKGTTSTLIANMLEEAGHTSHLVGNIGKPPLEEIGKIKPDDWVVLEISSFQLEDFKGPSPHIAVCLMVVPEHLNWHANMDEYTKAKSNLFTHQTDQDYAIYFNENDISKKIAEAGKGKKLPFFKEPGAFVNNGYVEIEDTKVCKIEDIKLLGKHNWQNVCAAVTAVWQITPDVDAIASVIKGFSGLEHRLEFVRELDNVKYYDDSFATTPETSVAAIQAFEQPKVLILGGSDKGVPLDPITYEVVKSNVRHVIAIGDMGPTIEKQLRDRGFTDISVGLTTMTDMINEAREHAKSGDVVLLSTGCASFGLFKDYKDRGNQFKTAVRSLS